MLQTETLARNAVDPGMTVAELALEAPAVIPALEELNIDYFCHGQATLAQACAQAGVPLEALLEVAARALAAEPPPNEKKWASEPLFGLIPHIEDHYHFLARREIVRLEGLLSQLEQRDLEAPISVLRSVFRRLSRLLLQHLNREESEIFAYLTELEERAARKEPLPQAPYGSLEATLDLLRGEHAQIAALLREMRSLTSHYTLPADAPAGWEYVYDELRAFEHDLQVHLHLENNLLFPRALRLAARAAARMAQGA
jgi:regulator of cell morphogenesis and NO signaling